MWPEVHLHPPLITSPIQDQKDRGREVQSPLRPWMQLRMQQDIWQQWDLLEDSKKQDLFCCCAICWKHSSCMNYMVLWQQAGPFLLEQLVFFVIIVVHQKLSLKGSCNREYWCMNYMVLWKEFFLIILCVYFSTVYPTQLQELVYFNGICNWFILMVSIGSLDASATMLKNVALLTARASSLDVSAIPSSYAV